MPRRTRSTTILGMLITGMILVSSAHADEGGVSFWLPGQYGGLAAVAPSPSFAVSTMS
ncbi:hypothetical protein [Rhizobium leguminosarum]|uniref:hypothetical protein n=1 Tax=Rhizobium leguminosarum TaxID=384 RepID=UPI001FEE7190|nr:hypothetical protein [Rhizobium leguminosarum]